MEYLLIAGLLILIGVREYLSYIERKDLYTRLMSKNIDDYKFATDKQEELEEPKEDEDLINMALTTDEISSLSDDVREEMEHGGKETN